MYGNIKSISPRLVTLFYDFLYILHILGIFRNVRQFSHERLFFSSVSDVCEWKFQQFNLHSCFYSPHVGKLLNVIPTEKSNRCELTLTTFLLSHFLNHVTSIKTFHPLRNCVRNHSKFLVLHALTLSTQSYRELLLLIYQRK